MHKPTLPRLRQGGFSLVELLVVITVIVILLSLLLPALRLIRFQAMVTICSTHMSQWGSGLGNYVVSNAGYFPDNRNAGTTPDLTVGGQHVSWNSSVVQRFFREYVEPLSAKAKTDEWDLLNCPTQKWHQINDVGTGGGLVGYFYLPFRTPTNINYTFAQGGQGNGWVAKRKPNGPFSHAPLLIDMKQFSTSYNSWWYTPNPNIAFSSHIDATGQPIVVNMLFEDGHVFSYRGEQVKLGATMGGWDFYYDPF